MFKRLYKQPIPSFPSFVLKNTLYNGQLFNWIETSRNTHVGVIRDHVVELCEDSNSGDIDFRCISTHSSCDKEVITLLNELFQLNVSLETLYETWIGNLNDDTNINDIQSKVILSTINGIRLVQQEPLECLFSFITSSNNNIGRIDKLLYSLRETFGSKIAIDQEIWTSSFLQDEKMSVRSFYSFPTCEALAETTEEKLRSLGFGYRAKFIHSSAKKIMELGGSTWLNNLRSNPDMEFVQSELEQLPGIGKKVADCIALFSLQKGDAIPVDTHVWHIACRWDPTLLKSKSLTPSIYKRVGDLFRSKLNAISAFAILIPKRNIAPVKIINDLPLLYAFISQS